MKFQDTKASCGVFALYNALRALGMYRSPDELATLCKTTATDGTSPKKLWDAVRKIDGLAPWRLAAGTQQAAMGLLWFEMKNGRPIVALVDHGEHWVAVVGALATRVLVADSAHNDLVLSYAVEEWLARWNCGGRHAFSGVVL